jgi:hypothetical protein
MKNELTIKKLNKAYYKRLKTLNKDFFKVNSTGLELFGMYLSYLRDKLIIESPTENTSKIATIITAIAEFKAYEKSTDSQKVFHWNMNLHYISLSYRKSKEIKPIHPTNIRSFYFFPYSYSLTIFLNTSPLSA